MNNSAWIIFFAVFSGIWIGGCSILSWQLPSGEPPRGEIVATPLPEPQLDERAAENRLITTLGAYALTALPNAKLGIRADDSLKPTAMRILRAIGAVAGTVYAPEAPIVLRLRSENNVWQADFFDLRNKTILFQEHLVLKKK